MTPRAYETARRLAAEGSGATPAERENAAARVAEYEAKHGKPAERPFTRQPFYAAPPRRYRPDEYPMHTICMRCGKDFTWHYMAWAMGPAHITCDDFQPRVERFASDVLCKHCGVVWSAHEFSRLCPGPGFEPAMRPGLSLGAICLCGHPWACHYPGEGSGKSATTACGGTNTAPGCACRAFRWAPVPWWQLTLRTKSGRKSSITGEYSRRLGLTSEYRQALRSIRAEVKASTSHLYVVRLGWGCYEVPPETAARLEFGSVDWTDFPVTEQSGQPWRPSPATRKAIAAWRKAAQGK